MIKNYKDLQRQLLRAEAELAYEIYRVMKEKKGIKINRVLSDLGAEKDENGQIADIRHYRRLYHWATVHSEILCDGSYDTSDIHKTDCMFTLTERAKNEAFRQRIIDIYKSDLTIAEFKDEVKKLKFK